MSDIQIHDFQAPATSEQTIVLSALRGKHVVLYFYPKDNTPGCTTETTDFRNLHEQFLASNTVVFGVSRDSLKSHENFRRKLELPFELISDADESLCNQFNVIKQKTMYGKQVRGIERSTFVFNTEGQLVQEWRGVKVPGHAQAVLDFVKTL